jgi:hypothetical protein
MELRQCHATVRPRTTLGNHPTRDTSRAMRERVEARHSSGLEIVGADIV